jgi:hypothetical protein
MTADPTPQFSTAEFEPQLIDTNAHFVRAMLFGLVGALAGLTLYATVILVTNYEIGFVSLAVGWIVGKSVLFGSDGRTGRRYQITAALLTYFAVSVAIIPVALVQVARGDVVVDGATLGEQSGATGTPAGTTPDGALAAPTDADFGPPPSMLSVLFQLLLLGLAAPFLNLQDMPNGLIGALILGIGIHIAWKMTGGTRDAAIVAEALAPHRTDERPTSLDINRP